MGNLYLHTLIRNTGNILELWATLPSLFLMFSTIPCHLQLPLCLLPDDSLAAERSHLPVLGFGEWSVDVLRSPVRYALNLSLIQGQSLSYLKVIMSLFLPKKLNLSKVEGLVFFHFTSNHPLFQRWKRKCGGDAESGTLLNILLCSCFSHTQHSLASRYLPSVIGRSGQVSLSWRCTFIHLKHYMPRIFLTHSSFSINIVIWLNRFYLQMSLKTHFLLPIFQALIILFFIAKLLDLSFLHSSKDSFQTVTIVTFLKPNIILVWLAPSQKWLTNFTMVQKALFTRPRVSLPGPLSCPAWPPLGSLHSSPGSPTGYSLEFLVHTI